MGLDQYIYKGSYNAVLERYENPDELQYFRKFDALHKWVCKNCMQEGQTDDNCEFIPIKIGKWRELYKITETLLEAYNKDKDDQNMPGEESMALAEKLFPPTPGLMYGHSVHDRHYFYYIQELHDVIKNAVLPCTEDMSDDDYSIDYTPLKLSDEDIAKIRSNRDRIEAMYAAYDKAYIDIYNDLKKKYGGRTYELKDAKLREQFSNEFDAAIVKWKEDNKFDDVVKDLFAGTNASNEDCYTHTVHGYYAWY